MSISFSQSLSCGSDSTKAGLEGALTGLCNIVGLGGVVSDIPGMDTEQKAKDALADANTNLQKVTAQWTTTLNNMKTQIQQDQVNDLQSLIDASVTQQSVINETLNENVESNSLLISMLIVLVLFLVMYDIL